MLTIDNNFCLFYINAKSVWHYNGIATCGRVLAPVLIFYPFIPYTTFVFFSLFHFTNTTFIPSVYRGCSCLTGFLMLITIFQIISQI